jgi:hypothetical protein
VRVVQMALPEALSDDAKDLIAKMLQRDSSLRITVRRTFDSRCNIPGFIFYLFFCAGRGLSGSSMAEDSTRF